MGEVIGFIRRQPGHDAGSAMDVGIGSRLTIRF